MNSFEYPDAETAWRGISSAGPYVVAMRHSGEEAVKRATLASLAPFATPAGGYRQNNKFRYVIADVGTVPADQSGKAARTEVAGLAGQSTSAKRRWWPWRR
jgi:hypothetical protein